MSTTPLPTSNKFANSAATIAAINGIISEETSHRTRTATQARAIAVNADKQAALYSKQPSRVEGQVESLWQAFEQANGNETAENHIAAKMLDVMTPQFHHAVRRHGIPYHLHDDGMGECRLALAYGLRNFPMSSRYGRVPFYTYITSLLRTNLYRFRQKEMAHIYHQVVTEGYAPKGLASGGQLPVAYQNDEVMERVQADPINQYAKADDSILVEQSLMAVLENAKLDERSKKIFGMYYIDGMSMGEIGVTLKSAEGVPLNFQIVSRCIARALKVVKSSLNL